jgi:hypothetical protein
MARITCSCKTCKVNAAQVGATFPLAAEISDTLAAALKGKGHHALVRDAHDPSSFGQAIRRTTGIRPV